MKVKPWGYQEHRWRDFLPVYEMSGCGNIIRQYSNSFVKLDAVSNKALFFKN